jgi:glycerol uptake facilitator-like aquaporin
MGNTRKYLAELIGTFALVLFGCGSVISVVAFLGCTYHRWNHSRYCLERLI